MRPNRRTVLAAAGALAGAASVAKAAERARPRALVLFDPQEPGARAFAEAQAGKAVALRGDRIRLARRLLAQGGPDRLTVIGRHADVLLVSDAAREQGYRTLAHEPFPALGGGLYIWSGQRRA
jgi:hypothetical protein